jgi:hypothetical protein
MPETDYLRTMAINWGVFLILLVVVIYICRSFWKLARQNNKSGFLFAAMGFGVIVAGNFLGLWVNAVLNPGDGGPGAVAASLLWLLIMLLPPYMLNRYLRSRWRKEIETR